MTNDRPVIKAFAHFYDIDPKRVRGTFCAEPFARCLRNHRHMLKFHRTALAATGRRRGTAEFLVFNGHYIGDNNVKKFLLQARRERRVKASLLYYRVNSPVRRRQEEGDSMTACGTGLWRIRHTLGVASRLRALYHELS